MFSFLFVILVRREDLSSGCKKGQRICNFPENGSWPQLLSHLYDAWLHNVTKHHAGLQG